MDPLASKTRGHWRIIAWCVEAGVKAQCSSSGRGKLSEGCENRFVLDQNCRLAYLRRLGLVGGDARGAL